MKKEKLLKIFGRNVKLERIKKKLTQKQLARIMNVSPNYITYIEGGKQNVSLGKALEIADSLNIDIEKLLKFNNYKGL